MEDPEYKPYEKGLLDAVDKLRKYYCKFDQKPAYVLSLSTLFYIPLADFTDLFYSITSFL